MCSFTEHCIYSLKPDAGLNPDRISFKTEIEMKNRANSCLLARLTLTLVPVEIADLDRIPILYTIIQSTLADLPRHRWNFEKWDCWIFLPSALSSE
jgi:hypothetical protein